MGRRPKKSQYITGRFPCLDLEHLGENGSYQLFLGSPSTQQWCHEHGLSVCNVVDEICSPYRGDMVGLAGLPFHDAAKLSIAASIIQIKLMDDF
jgi:hypothetical protein